ALEQVVERREKAPRLRALDDPVVVGARDGHDLAHAQILQLVVGDAAELDRVSDRADRDDAALPSHESRHGGHRAEAAGVGYLKVVAGYGVRAGPVGPAL